MLRVQVWSLVRELRSHKLPSAADNNKKSTSNKCWRGCGEKGGEGDDRGWDGWMASLTRWTWVWVNSGSWWWIGRPGVLQFMGSQRVGDDWATEMNRCLWRNVYSFWIVFFFFFFHIELNELFVYFGESLVGHFICKSFLPFFGVVFLLCLWFPLLFIIF